MYWIKIAIWEGVGSCGRCKNKDWQKKKAKKDENLLKQPLIGSKTATKIMKNHFFTFKRSSST